MAPSQISREWIDFAATNPRIIDHSEDISKIRDAIHAQSLENVSMLKDPAFSVLAENVTVENSRIAFPEVSDHQYAIRIYRPSHSIDGFLPVMLYFHSGYWATGSVGSDELGCRAMIGHGNDLVIVSFEYRLAPEASWDDIFSDAENSMIWVSQNARKFGGDIRKGFFLAGATGSAHLAAICAIRARKILPGIRISGQCLIVPTILSWTNVDTLPQEWTNLVTSHNEHADAPLLRETDFQHYLSLLRIPDSETRKGENFPAWADHSGLPPTYLAMDGPDPTRDEGYLYEKLLREARVRTRTDHYEMPNWFVQFPQMHVTRRAGVELAAGVRWLLDLAKYNF